MTRSVLRLVAVGVSWGGAIVCAASILNNVYLQSEWLDPGAWASGMAVAYIGIVAVVLTRRGIHHRTGGRMSAGTFYLRFFYRWHMRAWHRMGWCAMRKMPFLKLQLNHMHGYRCDWCGMVGQRLELDAARGWHGKPQPERHRNADDAKVDPK